MRAKQKREYGYATSHLGHKYTVNTYKKVMVNSVYVCGVGEGGKGERKIKKEKGRIYE